MQILGGHGISEDNIEKMCLVWFQDVRWECSDRVRLIDFETPKRNRCLVANQYTVHRKPVEELVLAGKPPTMSGKMVELMRQSPYYHPENGLNH